MDKRSNDMAVTFQVESISALPEMQRHFAAHWQELGEKSFPLNPDYELYRRLSEAGVMRVFTVRHGGELIAYSVYIVGGDFHYQQKKAEIDIYWVHPDWRSRRGIARWLKSKLGFRSAPGIGMRLFAYAEKCLCAEGVRIIDTRVKIASPGAGHMLSRLGYAPIEIGYRKVIGHA